MFPLFPQPSRLEEPLTSWTSLALKTKTKTLLFLVNLEDTGSTLPHRAFGLGDLPGPQENVDEPNAAAKQRLGLSPEELFAPPAPSLRGDGDVVAMCRQQEENDELKSTAEDLRQEPEVGHAVPPSSSQDEEQGPGKVQPATTVQDFLARHNIDINLVLPECFIFSGNFF